MLTFQSLWKHRELIARLTKREILGRYQGAALGLIWSAVIPLISLSIYTLIFSQVFKAHWGNLEEEGSIAFALNAFAGLISFNILSECVTKSPNIISDNPNYVKKIIFPVEIMAASTTLAACFNGLISLGILIAFQLVALHKLPLTVLWMPMIWLPLILGCLSASWLLAATGVFLRDISQATPIALNLLMFASPIFYPISALPAAWQKIMELNPLAHIILETRRACIEGGQPHISYLAIGTLTALAACEISLRIFNRSKKFFADVL